MGFRSFQDIQAFVAAVYRLTGAAPHELPIYEDDLSDLVASSSLWFFCTPGNGVDSIMGIPVKRLPPRGLPE